MNKNNELAVRFVKLRAGAQEPRYSTDDAACFDFFVPEDTEVRFGEVELVKLGLAVEVPKGHALLIFPRSSIGLKTPLRMANSVGIIDADYRGEISAIYENQSDGDYTLKKGERVAQGMIIPVPKVRFFAVDRLTQTKRGVGGFGSTGR